MKVLSQAETPWLGSSNAHDIAQTEMLIMRVVGWRLGCLTAASFLDQLLADALTGALFHLRSQPADYLSTARQLAAKLLAYTMPGLAYLLCLPSVPQDHALCLHMTSLACGSICVIAAADSKIVPHSPIPVSAYCCVYYMVSHAEVCIMALIALL